MRRTIILITALLCCNSVSFAQLDSVEKLGLDTWAWRAITQANSGDDIPRIVRPPRWLPDWSPAAVKARYQKLAAFEQRWQALRGRADSAPAHTDYQLVGSVLARVRWELDHVGAWKRQPHFYIAQTLTPIFETLLPPPPLDAPRVAELRSLLQRIPHTLAAAQQNLNDRRGPFVEVALAQLDRVPASLLGLHQGLSPYLSKAQHQSLQQDIDTALQAFAQYRVFLQQDRDSLPSETSVGIKSYQFFLSQVALYPFTPDQLLIMGAQEWQRTAAFESFEANRNQKTADLPIAANIDTVIERLNSQELGVRKFLKQQQILTVPDGMGHYRGHAFPSYLKPIAWLGRTLDLTNQQRLGSNATVYLPDPSPTLGFFNLSIARDPRPIIVHEGVPGHYFQLALSWAHPTALRRHYYDSGANEGTGFYAEEMLLQAGYFDNSPKTREIIYSFARLRALRVEVDVKLALGEFNIDQAADYLQKKLKLDRNTALEEAVFFAATPGQAISYQIGKLQTLAFLSAAREQMGEQFNLKHFHDYLWRNGNVPIALLQAEYLTLNDK
jgi:hypothetical protein